MNNTVILLYYIVLQWISFLFECIVFCDGEIYKFVQAIGYNIKPSGDVEHLNSNEIYCIADRDV